MILFPAIDLKDGRCVRLARGEMAAATVFNDDPAAQAETFQRQGFRYLHLVDLNGAFAGRPVNGAAVDIILGAVTIPVQLGGGIRDLATIEGWLGKGVRRVILGTLALRNPALVREACRLFPGRIAVGIDARAGKVAVEGWAETSELSVLEMAARYEDAGVAAIIHTDIERDGVLKGLNLPATAELARATFIPVIASGGFAGIDDVKALLRPEHAMLAGAIAGRALYDGRLDAAEALALLARHDASSHPDSRAVSGFGEPMRHDTHRGFQEGGVRDIGTRQADLIKSAPTDPEAFLLWSTQLEREDGKFELSRGRVVCDMIYASSYHSRVVWNLAVELGRLLDSGRFEVGISDFAVRTPYGVRSPDIVVTHTQPRRLSTTAPIFIVEVLSPSTADTDFTEKLQEYTAIATLQTYVICSQDEPRAWVWARRGDGSWPTEPEELAGRDGAIALVGLGVELVMAAVFRGIPDAPTTE